LADMVSDSHRTSEVLSNIRALFDTEEYEQEEVDANTTASDALRLVRGELDDHGITAKADFAADLPRASGNRGQLREVLINLLRNAIEAMVADPSGDRLLTLRTKVHGGNFIAVEVEDTGPGIKPEDLDRVFEAFVTTKSKGRGLGLAISRAIVERLRGQLSVSPATPRGAVFRIVLPQMALPY